MKITFAETIMREADDSGVVLTVESCQLGNIDVEIDWDGEAALLDIRFSQGCAIRWQPVLPGRVPRRGIFIDFNDRTPGVVT